MSSCGMYKTHDWTMKNGSFWEYGYLKSKNHLRLSFLSRVYANLVYVELGLLPKYQPKRGGDLGWGKLFRFKCGIKNYFQIENVDLANVWSQFNCNIDMIWNQTQVYI